MVTEKDILHETANLYLARVRNVLEIRLNGLTHSVVVGTTKDANPESVEKAKGTMAKLERNIKTVRKVFKHW